jgi:hypothetical protein
MARWWKWSRFAVTREVKSELLDELPPDDAAAVRSRHDLNRVNSLMGNRGFLAGAMLRVAPKKATQRVLELGSGDGLCLLGVSRLLQGKWSEVDALLLDRQDIVRPETQKAFSSVGWKVNAVQRDVFEFLESPAAHKFDLVIANLFLHHFKEGELQRLFECAAAISIGFVAVEPRRNLWSLSTSRCLGVVGCNAVTRHDAVVSVRAGFHGRELSMLWPQKEGWELEERAIGLFSHLFTARHNGTAQDHGRS